MARKPKFKPKITRVKLNPEQAVLTCDCYVVGRISGRTSMGMAYSTGAYCSGRAMYPIPTCVGGLARVLNCPVIGSSNTSS